MTSPNKTRRNAERNQKNLGAGSLGDTNGLSSSFQNKKREGHCLDRTAHVHSSLITYSFFHEKSTLSPIKQKSSNNFANDSVCLFKNTQDSYELMEGFSLFLNIWHGVCGYPVVVVCFRSCVSEAGGGVHCGHVVCSESSRLPPLWHYCHWGWIILCCALFCALQDV